MKNRTQPTATINKEVDITMGADIFIVGFEITARIDAGSKDSRDTPGEPASVDEWTDLKIEYVTCLTGGKVTPQSRSPLIEQHILGLAEMSGMDWVDEFDQWEDYDDDDYDRERE
mgnify:CR=1 FL=1